MPFLQKKNCNGTMGISCIKIQLFREKTAILKNNDLYLGWPHIQRILGQSKSHVCVADPDSSSSSPNNDTSPLSPAQFLPERPTHIKCHYFVYSWILDITWVHGLYTCSIWMGHVAHSLENSLSQLCRYTVLWDVTDLDWYKLWGQKRAAEKKINRKCTHCSMTCCL